MKNFWKIYFWIYLIYIVSKVLYYTITGTLGASIPTYSDNLLVHILVYVLMFIPVAVIHGLAYKKKYLHHIFWKIYFFWYLLSVSKNLVHITEAGISFSVFVPFEIITLFGLFIYSFQQNKLFGKTQKA